MTNELISTLFQLLAFTAIPFIVYLVKYRKKSSFLLYIGIKTAPKKALYLSFAAIFLLVLPILLLFYFNEEFRAVLLDPKSLTGSIKTYGFSFQTLILLVLIAVVKTALSEEIFFRGFLAKRLISITNFAIGNGLQSIIFGALHILAFLGITDNLGVLLIIFIFPALFSFVVTYINEIKANGSIVPGWIAHATANLITYTLVLVY